MYTRLAQSPVVLAAIGIVHLLLGRAGYTFLSIDVGAPAIWLPSGFGLAAIVLFGPRVWVAIAAGAFVTDIMQNRDVLAAFANGTGHALEALVGATLVERFASGAEVFRSSMRIFRFVAIAMGASAIGASIGAASMSLNAPPGLFGFAYLWMTWWLGHLGGCLTVAPFVLLWGHGGRTVRWRELAEGLVQIVLLGLVCLVVFAGRFPSDIKTYPLEFLCVPFFLWAAFRLGRRAVAGGVLLMSVIAAWGTLHGFGPFVRDTPNESIVLLQSYVAVMAVMGLVLAAVVAEQKRAEAQLQELASTDSLTGLVNYRRLLDVLRLEIARSRRSGRPFAVVLVDMNGLKSINDRYGHLTGSRALCRLADVLRRAGRAIDTAARFGGDEFALVLPETGAAGGAAVLRRVVEMLAADTDTPPITASGGVAMFPRDGDSPTLLLRAADQALYEAKTKIKNAGVEQADAPEKLISKRSPMK